MNRKGPAQGVVWLFKHIYLFSECIWVMRSRPERRWVWERLRDMGEQGGGHRACPLPMTSQCSRTQSSRNRWESLTPPKNGFSAHFDANVIAIRNKGVQHKYWGIIASE